MGKLLFLLLATCVCIHKTDGANCEVGWTAYKDKICVKLFPDILTYEDAKSFCAINYNSILITVNNFDVQMFLTNFTENIFNNIWLGGRYNSTSTKFHWEDDSPLNYTNWADGFPRYDTNSEPCMQLRPINDKVHNFNGKWEDIPCEKRNLVVCQQAPKWSLEDAALEISNLKTELKAVRHDLKYKIELVLIEAFDDAIRLKSELQELNAQIEMANAKVVPIGFIYVEYYNQPNPALLWPNFSWRDITASYAGLFFRALGGNSEYWGQNQNDCAPKIKEVQYSWSPTDPFDNYTVAMPEKDWSRWQVAGVYHQGVGGNPRIERLRFNIEGCEVRPPNQAVKIWKRVE